MRPVVRGEWPKDEKGNDLHFSQYQRARGLLIDRLGEYCSYCEMQLDSSLAVEHVKPKKPKGETDNIGTRELDWNNFLLACSNCNSSKGNVELVLVDYYWPDQDNTFLALKYSEGGIVNVSVTLSGKDKKRAEKTIRLTGLDKQPLNDPNVSDRRWLNRKETWDIAVRAKSRLLRVNQPEMREQIIENAMAKGFWSVWMTVFADDADMLLRLIEAFPGTCKECFDRKKGNAPIRR